MPTSTPALSRVAVWALVLTLALIAVGTGVAVRRLRPTPGSLLGDGRSGWRSVPPDRTVEPGSAIITSAPEAATTDAPEPTTTTATTVVTKPAKPTATDLPPLRSGRVHTHVTAIGDSVMLEAGPELAATIDDLTLDAVNGRQVGAIIEAAQTLHDAGRLTDEVVVQVGNNGPVTSAELDQLMSLFAGAQRVAVLNLKADREWEGPNNDVLAAGVARWPNAVLLDWFTLASADPEGLLSDGVHLRSPGVELYTRLILSGL